VASLGCSGRQMAPVQVTDNKKVVSHLTSKIVFFSGVRKNAKDVASLGCAGRQMAPVCVRQQESCKSFNIKFFSSVVLERMQKTLSFFL